MCSATIVPTSLTELPFGLPGRIFRSSMPYKSGDSQGRIFEQYKRENISVIVMLAEDDECIRKTGHDLRALYRAEGLEVTYLPIPDFGVPQRNALSHAVDTTIIKAHSGKNIVVHCNGGLGRTGMFLACMAERVLDLSGEEAISWVREWIPGAIETEAQYKMVLDC